MTQPFASNPFTIPRPATVAPGLTGQLPIPIGKPMILKSPSPGERAILEEFGWQDGQPIPENFGEILRAAKEESVNLQDMLPPAPMNTPKLVMPVEQNIADMSKSEQEKYIDIVQQAMAATKSTFDMQQSEQDAIVLSAGEGINNAILKAMSPPDVVTLANDMASDSYDSGQPKQSEPTVEQGAVWSNPSLPTYCINCGWSSEDKEVVDISPSDKDMFLQSVLGGVPFVKTYRSYGGKIAISIRSLSPEEIDMCFRQRVVDLNVKRAKTPADELELLTRYRSALQVTEVLLGQTPLQLPKTLASWEETVKHVTQEDGDTPVRAIWDMFQQHVCKTETLHRLVMSTVFRFNQLVRRLEDNSVNPDFW